MIQSEGLIGWAYIITRGRRRRETKHRRFRPGQQDSRKIGNLGREGAKIGSLLGIL